MTWERPRRLEEQIARMKKNQERRLHRKNAKIVKEGGTPMQLTRPLKPDTTVSFSGVSKRIGTYGSVQRRCGHCGQMGHMSTSLHSKLYLVANFRNQETNRKCPRWAEFNSGTVPVASASATSPPPMTPSMSSLSGFNRSGFGAPVPSPLATSPPVSAMEDIDSMMPPTPSGSAPKIKLTLKRT